MEDGSLLLLQLLFLGFLILLNAFFASSEVALISLKPATVRRLGTEGGRRGRRLADLVGNSGRFLATVQVGVTFAGFMASAFAADTFSEPVTGWLYGLGFQFLSKKILGGVIMVAITILLSYISLVFGELVPKQLGLRYAEAVALNVAGPIDFIARVTAPFVWFLNASVNFVLRLFGVTPGNSQEVTEEEIRMMVDIGEENGAIESDEKRMIENVFEFNNTTAAEVMTHRTEMVALDIEAPPEEVEKVLMSCGFSRVPVYREDIDEIIGFLHFREYLSAKVQGNSAPDIRKLLKPVYLAPETMRANILFRNMQSKKFGMAIILDEFGGTSGLVTIEDLLEEIVGSLYDEYDEADIEIEQLGEGEWRIDGSMRLDEISRRLDLALPEEEYDTIGGLVFGMLNEVPTVGATVELPVSGISIRVESVEERRVDKVILQYTPPQEEESGE
ncbi:hemolysin family protein [Victivallis vadensis]|uniref:HlyC/CorC family transporter n=3 Tax=Victivallis TaxID=172900 RepID=A0A848AYZ3_9BACT|nr:hemolysin family protein [Victivallis vadensis]NMD87267.1 HlyC/CorC family transporter [Victivallis vadensis]